MRVLVLGHRGFAGSAICRRLRDDAEVVVDAEDPWGVPSAKPASRVDLRVPGSTTRLIELSRPDAIVLAAARGGGIQANIDHGFEFLRDNLLIQTHVMAEAEAAGIQRLVFLGSTCVYPREAVCPIPEGALLTGPLEPTNAAYALAKIAGIEFVLTHRAKHRDSQWSALMPANLYGPGDSFHPRNSHVLAALVRKAVEAHAAGSTTIEVWGNLRTRRELLYVDDLADAVAFVLRQKEPMPALMNVGSGFAPTIGTLAELVMHRVFGHEHGTVDVVPGPVGAPVRYLHRGRLHGLGWRARTPFEAGLEKTIAWYEAHR